MSQADQSIGGTVSHVAAPAHTLPMVVYMVPDDGRPCQSALDGWRALVDPTRQRNLHVSDDDGASLMSLLRLHETRAKALIVTVVPMDVAVPTRVPLPDSGVELAPLVQPSAPALPGLPADTLTAREAAILTPISWGQSAAQVTMRTGLSQHTVSTHLRNCDTKRKARNRLQAVHRARELGHLA